MVAEPMAARGTSRRTTGGRPGRRRGGGNLVSHLDLGKRQDPHLVE